MTSPFSRLLALVLALLAFGCAIPGGRAAQRPPLILISIDGFRPDYLDRGLTPTLAELARTGVRAPAMRPSFPANTFPNHYTLVTGLRPDRHGIVDNTMEDPALPGGFALSKKEATADGRWWSDAEPLWVTAKRQGRHTSTMFWPGSDAEIRRVRPDDWRAFSYGVPLTQRVDTVLGWLDRPAKIRPDFVTLYFEPVDVAAHHHSPVSPETDAALSEVEAALARLVAGLRARGLEHRVNLVIVSDHGMAASSNQRLIVWDDLVDLSKIRLIGAGPFVGVLPAAGYDAATERALLAPGAHHRCWRKGEIPVRFHYGAHRRVPPVVCLAQTGWLFITRAAIPRARVVGGEHGYDPEDPLMAALFVANGPAFRRGAIVPAFDNVDLYPLMARLLGVRPQANDGDLRELGPALRR